MQPEILERHKFNKEILAALADTPACGRWQQTDHLTQ